jgi:hypothetical protein
MKKTTIAILVKNAEQGLLGLNSDQKSLLPVFGGMRIIDFYVSPFAELRMNIHVLFTKHMDRVRDHLLFSYPSGRLNLAQTDNVPGALQAIAGHRKSENLLLLRADGMFLSSWNEIQDLSSLSPGVYELKSGKKLLGYYFRERRLDEEIPLSPELSARVEHTAIEENGGKTRRQAAAKGNSSTAGETGQVKDQGPVYPDVDELWEHISSQVRKKLSPSTVALKGEYYQLEDVWEYYRTHMSFLDQPESFLPWFAHFASGDTPSHISKSGMVTDSAVSHSCSVHGEVQHSILFPHVRVAKNARVVNAILLEQNFVGEEAVVQNAVLCPSVSKVSPNIGDGAVVGGDERGGANDTFSEALHGGITLVGRNVEIPRECRISSNCYIGPGVERSILKKKSPIRSGAALTAE